MDAVMALGQGWPTEDFAMRSSLNIDPQVWDPILSMLIMGRCTFEVRAVRRQADDASESKK